MLTVHCASLTFLFTKHSTCAPPTGRVTIPTVKSPNYPHTRFYSFSVFVSFFLLWKKRREGKMAALDMATITEYLERTMQNCSLNSNLRERSSMMDENDDHIQIVDKTVDLNSHFSIPSNLEQCLDLKVNKTNTKPWRFFFLFFFWEKHPSNLCRSRSWMHIHWEEISYFVSYFLLFFCFFVCVCVFVLHLLLPGF